MHRQQSAKEAQEANLRKDAEEFHDKLHATLLAVATGTHNAGLAGAHGSDL